MRKTGSCSGGGAVLIKFLVQFSTDGGVGGWRGWPEAKLWQGYGGNFDLKQKDLCQHATPPGLLPSVP